METRGLGRGSEQQDGSRRRAPGRALWEFTWRCDLRCAHCLVDAGPTELIELDTAEALDLVDQIADLGVTAVTLSGGEPLLRPDWTNVAERITRRGLIFRLATTGNLVDEEVVEHLVGIGAQRVVMSVDGTRETHDHIRQPAHSRAPSRFDRVMRAMDLLAPGSVGASVITSVMQPNLPELPAIHALLKERGVEQWTIQLAHPTGRLGFRPRLDGKPLLLEPEHLEDLFAFLVAAAEDPVLPPIVFNSIGYLGAEEPRVRPSGRRNSYPFWRGCQCGVTSVGFEPDGGVKGCANQVGDPFVVGNVRDEPLVDIWDDLPRWHWLSPDPDELTGHCGECALGKVCGAGCTALAHATSGRLFDNPYCIRDVRRQRAGVR